MPKLERINSIVDFKEEFKDAIYYQGLEISFKSKLKSNSSIKYADFNYYDIANIDFIFDNYLSIYDKNIVLEIPISAKEYIKNMSIFELMNQINRVQIIVQADAALQGSYSGMVDMKKMDKTVFDWMRDISDDKSNNNKTVLKEGAN